MTQKDDVPSNYAKAKNKEVCIIEKPIEKMNNVQNKNIENIIQLSEAIMEVRFLLKCLFVVFVFFGLAITSIIFFVANFNCWCAGIFSYARTMLLVLAWKLFGAPLVSGVQRVQQAEDIDDIV